MLQLRDKTIIDKAFDEVIKSDFNYLHPVTGKPITREEFDILAKQQNWTEEEILNNLKCR